MATKIETLKKPNGDQVLPRTRAKAVSMENGTTVEAAIADINTSINNLPSVDGHIGTHNTSADSHSDIRTLVQNLTARLNALADSDDITLDQMSELVAYIKSNKSLIEQVTTNKVNVTDVINNLTTEASDKPLSAAQGAVLKGLIDELASIGYVDEKLIMLQSSLDKTIRGKADKADVEDDLAALESKLTKSIEGKATKTTTLSGYGITDAYTKIETEEFVNQKFLEDEIITKSNLISNLPEGGVGYIENNSEGAETIHTIEPKFLPDTVATKTYVNEQLSSYVFATIIDNVLVVALNVPTTILEKEE